MGKKHHRSGRRPNHRRGDAPAPVFRPPAATFERKPTIVYGKPFILLEDDRKQAFIYQGGQWVQHAATIAECRASGQVKELPQKINGMTRYEVSLPVTSAG